MNYKSYLKWIPAVVAVSIVIFSSSCNDNNNTGTSSPGTPGQTLYFANLTPVPLNDSVTNQQQSGGPMGTAEFTLNGDSLTSTITMMGLDPNTEHLQFVNFAHNCPTSAADTNGDGVIDVMESLAVTGPILFPLNANLLQLTNTEFQTSDADGNYSYTQTTSYSQLLAALSAPTPSPTPSPSASPSTTVNGTLAPGAPLALDTRVVVVHGVSLSRAIPGTAATFQGYAVQESIPVACGPLQIVSAFPSPSPSVSPSPSASPSPSPSPSPSVSPSVSPSPSPSSM